MVSNNGPPLPMPMQVPPGHMVQQIVDEHGILTHVILSPQPPGMPNQPMTVGYYVCISCFFPSLLCQQTVYGMLGYAKLLYAWAWFGHHVGCWHTCFAETGISIVWKKVILFMFSNIYIYIYICGWMGFLVNIYHLKENVILTIWWKCFFTQRSGWLKNFLFAYKF